MRYLIIAENPSFSVSHRADLLRRLRSVLWRKTRNAALQGLIMLAAAFVKLQEGQPDKFERMLKEALHLLKEDVGCIKMGRLLEKAEKALLEKRPFKIECP
jgi:predicted metal-dependent hydrolase